MEVIRIPGSRETSVRKVAAYARVSTLQEEQGESFEAQTAYYEEYIRSVPGWSFAGIYADRGFSGRDSLHRPGFQRMIRDAGAGKIDLILVKSISRFSRSAADAQRYLQLLREADVEVRFDTEQLSSFNRNTEMALNTLAICAEMESKSISDNVRWTYRRLASRGIRRLGSNHVTGYDEPDGTLLPNEQAETVRMIFEAYAAGAPMTAIIDRLQLRGVRTLRGRERYSPSAISYILHNEIYTGDRKIQKQPPRDYYTKRPEAGKDYTSYYIYNSHEPIVSREIWDAVQERLRTKGRGDAPGSVLQGPG